MLVRRLCFVEENKGIRTWNSNIALSSRIIIFQTDFYVEFQGCTFENRNCRCGSKTSLAASTPNTMVYRPSVPVGSLSETLSLNVLTGKPGMFVGKVWLERPDPYTRLLHSEIPRNHHWCCDIHTSDIVMPKNHQINSCLDARNLPRSSVCIPVAEHSEHHSPIEIGRLGSPSFLRIKSRSCGQDIACLA